MEDDRRLAFELYRQYLSEYDFSQIESIFFALVGVPYDGFFDMTVDEFLEIRGSTPARDTVLFEFEYGMLGLRWIVKYFKAWIKYKFKKSR